MGRAENTHVVASLRDAFSRSRRDRATCPQAGYFLRVALQFCPENRPSSSDRRWPRQQPIPIIAGSVGDVPPGSPPSGGRWRIVPVSEAGYHPLYLRGIEQFNRQSYFESHEVWECLWLGETGPARLFYKGLIQAAVALHHLTKGNAHGANKLLLGSQRYLEPYRPWYLGLNIDGFLAAMRCCFDHASANRPAVTPALLPKIELQPPPHAGGH